MKDIRSKLSVTKLVFLIVMICLCVFTGYQYWIGQEITIKLRETVVTAIVSFYFWQKVGESKKDPLINLDDKETEVDGENKGISN